MAPSAGMQESQAWAEQAGEIITFHTFHKFEADTLTRWCIQGSCSGLKGQFSSLEVTALFPSLC